MAHADLNGPISKNQIDDSALSWKQLLHKAKAEANRIIKDAKIQFVGNEPDDIEKVVRMTQPLVNSGIDVIDSKIKEETGYTLQEIRYKTVHLYQYMHEMEKEGANKEELKEKFDKEMEKLPDEMYNAFYLGEIKNTLDNSKIILEQSRDVGTKMIDSVVDQMNFIKDNFKKGGALGKPIHVMEYGFMIETDEVNSGIDTNEDKYEVEKEETTQIYEEDPTQFIDQDLLKESLLSELAKTKQTTRGEEVEKYNRKTADSSNTCLALISSLFPLFSLMKVLFTYFLKNKKTIKDDADFRTTSLLENNAQIMGLDKSIPASDITKNVMQGMKGWNDEENSTEMSPYNPLTDAQTILFYPNSDSAYMSDESMIFSELDRLYNSLDKAEKHCKLDLRYPLVSKSKVTNGGKVENLKHSGNNRYEMIDAIEALNGGQRL